MEWACGVPFALTILVVGGVWVVEQCQAMARHGAVRGKALQVRASSLRSVLSEQRQDPMAVPPGRA